MAPVPPVTRIMDASTYSNERTPAAQSVLGVPLPGCRIQASVVGISFGYVLSHPVRTRWVQLNLISGPKGTMPVGLIVRWLW